MNNDDALSGLREALNATPQNLPLRRYVATTLLGLGRYGEAEDVCRAGLTTGAEDPDLRLSLATAFFHQEKDSQAIVLLEDLQRIPALQGRAYLLHARILLRAGEIQRAALQYRRATELDLTISDPDLATQLGIASGAGASQAAVSPANREPQLTFEDVGGMDALKDEIRMKIVYPITHPEAFLAYGKTAGGGVLMYGPPGCGKTHLARATAGEIEAGFVSVGIQEILEMWHGNSERNLHEIFERARRNKPSVLFFDEMDALGASRTNLRQSSGRSLVNQFLAEMDGLNGSNEGVLILAATNTPWHVDAAFRRPGRFDRVLFVPPPDAEARAAILRILCRNKPANAIDYDALGRRADSFSGADLAGAVDLAVEQRLREAIRGGVPQPLTTAILADALSVAKPSTREWLATARNYAVYANEGGAYNDLVKYLGL